MIKVVSRLASLLIVAGALVFLSNCGGDDPKDPEQKQKLDALSKTWDVTKVTFGNLLDDRTDDFPGFTLTISGNFNSNNPNGPYNYSVTNNPAFTPWPTTSGTWTFTTLGSGNSGTLTRNDGVVMTYTINSQGELSLSFNYGDSGGRLNEIEGDWEFIFE